MTFKSLIGGPVPPWILHEFARVCRESRGPVCDYYTTCPASVAALPVVNGVVRL